VLQFTWPVRVYYEDTDAGGVVYHASYVRFMERARTEWLRACGFSQETLHRDVGVLFTVRSAHLDFLGAARLDDALEVDVQIADRRRASLIFAQAVRRTEEVLCRGEVRVACLSTVNLRPCAIPAPVVAAITAG
jgi:acyl-CoA thioester hydrolase